MVERELEEDCATEGAGSDSTGAAGSLGRDGSFRRSRRLILGRRFRRKIGRSIQRQVVDVQVFVVRGGRSGIGALRGSFVIQAEIVPGLRRGTLVRSLGGSVFEISELVFHGCRRASVQRVRFGGETVIAVIAPTTAHAGGHRRCHQGHQGPSGEFFHAVPPWSHFLNSRTLVLL